MKNRKPLTLEQAKHKYPGYKSGSAILRERGSLPAVAIEIEEISGHVLLTFRDAMDLSVVLGAQMIDDPRDLVVFSSTLAEAGARAFSRPPPPAPPSEDLDS